MIPLKHLTINFAGLKGVFHVNNGYPNKKAITGPTQGERQRAECACAAEDLGPTLQL